MKFAVVKIINGNFAIHSEGFTDLNKAKVSFYGFLSALYNDIDNVQSFSVMLMNDGGGIVEQENYTAPVSFDDMLAQNGMYVTEDSVESEE